MVLAALAGRSSAMLPCHARGSSRGPASGALQPSLRPRRALRHASSARPTPAAAAAHGVPSEGAAGPAQHPAAAAAGGAAVRVDAAGPAAPSRLQQEVELLVALDVEYTHLALLPAGRQVSLPAEVCAVDAAGKVLLLEHCNPIEGQLEGRRWRHVGGLGPGLWRYAPPLSEVRSRLAALLEGRILVGHHLRKDLKALALPHPPADLRDTMQYRELQGRGGAGRKLRQLSAERLGRQIQTSGRRHSPREDAQAAMDLYLQEVHFDRRYMQYDDLVQLHLADILGSMDEGAAAQDGGGEAAPGQPAAASE